VTNFVGRFAIAMLVAGSAVGAHAADDKIRIMVGGIEKQIYLPAALAQRLGYFKEQGLDVELLTEPSGVHAEDELLAGSVQGVVGFYDHTIGLQARGKFVQSVVQLAQAPGEAELVATRLAGQIKSPADFKGRALGVTGLGSSTHFLTIYLTKANGVKPSEIKLNAVGSGATFVSAMRQHSIDAGMTTEPTISQLLRSGEAKVLVDLRTPQSTQQVLGGLYPAACLYMTTVWISNHKAQVQKLANALVKTLRYIDTHTPEQIASELPSDYHVGEKAMYVEALRASKAMFTRDGRMPPAGPETVLKVLKVSNKVVQGKTIDLTKTYSSEFVDAAR
jgi:NitT/TauT family transport system substrate-binding protein